MRRLAITAAAVLIAVVVFVLVVHTPPVRRAVLRYVVAEVQRRYAIRIEASRLDYNLAELTIGLADVRVTALSAEARGATAEAERTADQPFFEAGYVRAALARRTLTGAVAFDEVAITNGRVRLIRDRDGRMNLPESSDTPSGEPAPLDIAHLSAPRFVVDVNDAQNDLALAIPGRALDIAKSSGRLTLNAPATVRVAKRQTRISTLDGGAAFDGRALKLTSVAMRADEASLQVDGVLSIIAKDPGMDLHVTGTADAARLARWGMEEGELPRGSLALDVRASGPFTGPTVDAQRSEEHTSELQSPYV